MKPFFSFLSISINIWLHEKWSTRTVLPSKSFTSKPSIFRVENQRFWSIAFFAIASHVLIIQNNFCVNHLKRLSIKWFRLDTSEMALIWYKMHQVSAVPFHCMRWLWMQISANFISLRSFQRPEYLKLNSFWLLSSVHSRSWNSKSAQKLETWSCLNENRNGFGAQLKKLELRDCRGYK